MSKKITPYFLIPFACGCIGFATLSAFWGKDTPSVQKQQFSEKVNLALRQTAHRLLKQAGDATSTIAPVKQTADNTYFVRLEHHFNYDSLPIFLQNSFAAHNIQGAYDVAVWDCPNKELVLGYSSFDLFKNIGDTTLSDFPCGGRNQAIACFNFTVTFTESSSFLNKNTLIWAILGGLSILGGAISAYFLYLNLNKKIKTTQTRFFNLVQTNETHLIYIGNSIFDTRKQIITINDMTQKLTFQESKLLQLFCNHPNELLDRDFILKSVWEDEGVLVTRSVDVFISRLRKILKEDATLKITNVHSRGYRFETEEI